MCWKHAFQISERVQLCVFIMYDPYDFFYTLFLDI